MGLASVLKSLEMHGDSSHQHAHNIRNQPVLNRTMLQSVYVDQNCLDLGTDARYTTSPTA